MRLMDMHSVERPRERLSRVGAASLKDDELLAVLIGTGCKGHDALAVARALLEKFPDGGLIRAGLDGLASVTGMGPKRAATLLAALELAERLKPGPALQPVLDSPRKVLD